MVGTSDVGCAGRGRARTVRGLADAVGRGLAAAGCVGLLLLVAGAGCSGDTGTTEADTLSADAADPGGGLDAVLDTALDVVLDDVAAPADAEVTGDPGLPPKPALAEVATGGCGAPSYAWIAPAGLGRVLVAEEDLSLSLDSGQIDSIVGGLGITSLSPVPYGVRVFRLRYTTQDRGKEIEATGLMAFPVLPAKADVPTVMWMHQTTGMEDFCAPSGRGILWAMPSILIASLGHAVVAPDYIGQNGFGDEAPFRHPFLLGEPAAVGALDALRALWAFTDSAAVPGDLPVPSRTVTLAGGSQGGATALWAQRYADAYLPEATVDAVLALAPPSDLLGMLESGATKLSVGGLAMGMVLALARDWYKGTASLDEVLTPTAQTWIEETIATECPKAELPAGIAAVSDVYSPAMIQAVADGTVDALQPWHCYVSENSLANSAVPWVSRPPILYVTGELDDVSLADVQRRDVQRLCDDGYRIQHIECAGLGHLDAALRGIPIGWKWIQERRAGVPIPSDKLCLVGKPMECEGE